jgi:hypothetical protein
VILILAILILAVSWGTRWWIWEPLANRRMQDHKDWSQAECHRYSQTCTSLLFFLMSTWFATHILLSKDWLFDRHAWIERGPLIDADYKFYYLMYAARFFSELASINFEERKRVRNKTKDRLFGGVLVEYYIIILERIHLILLNLYE